MWSVGDWRGWVLVPVFVAARVVGRWIGMTAGSKSFEAQDLPVPAPGPLITPLSVLSLALVVSVVQLYSVEGTSQTITWVMTAVIGGTIVSEILVQAVHFGDSAGPIPGRSDAGGEDDGPIYRGPGPAESRTRRAPTEARIHREHRQDEDT